MYSVKMEYAQCKPQGQLQLVIWTSSFLPNVNVALVPINTIPFSFCFLFALRRKMRVPAKDAILAGSLLICLWLFLCINVQMVTRTGTII